MHARFRLALAAGLAVAAAIAPGAASADPEIGWYEPVPAGYGEPLTIRGTGLASQPGSVLKWGIGDSAKGEIPGALVAKWTHWKIELSQLPIPEKGIYWIAIYQGGVLQSNRTETLFVQEGMPLQQLADPKEEPSYSGPMLSAKHLAKMKQAIPPPPRGDQIEMVEPSWPDPTAHIESFVPPVVAWEQKFKIEGSGFGASQGQRVLRWRNAHNQSGIVPASQILGWKDGVIRLVNRLPKNSVYAFAVMEGNVPVSNQLVGLQVQDDSPVSAPSAPPPLEPAQPSLEQLPLGQPIRTESRSQEKKRGETVSGAARVQSVRTKQMPLETPPEALPPEQPGQISPTWKR